MAETFLERALIWEKAQAALEAAKAEEARARDALLEHDFAVREIGTTTKALPGSNTGRVMKCVAELSYATDSERAKACIAKLEATGEEGRLLAGRLFKFRPEVAVGELKKLPKALRKIADKAIDVKDRRPVIRIETPKAA